MCGPLQVSEDWRVSWLILPGSVVKTNDEKSNMITVINGLFYRTTHSNTDGAGTADCYTIHFVAAGIVTGGQG